MTKTEQTTRRGFIAAGVAALATASLPALTRSESESRIDRTKQILSDSGASPADRVRRHEQDHRRSTTGPTHGDMPSASRAKEPGALTGEAGQEANLDVSLSDARLPKARQDLLDGIGYGSPFQTAHFSTVVARNALIGSLWSGAKLLTQEVLNHCSIDSSQLTQHPSQKLYLEKLRSKPLDTLITTCVAAPILEEVVFRALPSALLDQRGEHGLSWAAGIPISAIFALAHNLVPDKTKPLGITFDCSSVSIPTFASGLVFWYLQRTAGIDAAIVAHMANNCTHQAVQIAKLLGTATGPGLPSD